VLIGDHFAMRQKSLQVIRSLTSARESGHPERCETWIPGRASYRQLARNDDQIFPRILGVSRYDRNMK
jgi:hypothetical protein